MASFNARHRVIKSEARRLIFSNPLYFFSTSFLFLLLTSGTATVLKVYSRAISSFVPYGFRVCFDFILSFVVFLVLVPFFSELLGSYVLLKKAAAKEDIRFFGAFSDKKICFEHLRSAAFALVLVSCRLSAFYFLPKCAAALISSFGLGNEILDSVFGFSIYCLCFLLIALFCVYLNGFFMMFFRGSISTKESFYNKFSHSKEMMKGKKTELFFLNLSFFPHFLTVYFTFGITLIFVLPYYLNTLCSFASYVAEDSKKCSFYTFT